MGEWSGAMELLGFQPWEPYGFGRASSAAFSARRLATGPLTEARLRGFLEEGDFGELWPEADEMMRIRSEEFEEVHWYLLYRLGVASSPRFEPNPVGAAWRRAKDEPLRAAVFEPVAEAFNEFLCGGNDRGPRAGGWAGRPGPDEGDC